MGNYKCLLKRVNFRFGCRVELQLRLFADLPSAIICTGVRLEPSPCRQCRIQVSLGGSPQKATQMQSSHTTCHVDFLSLIHFRPRSKGRLPVLTYLHNDKMAAICRCSQPLSGFQKRSLEDEKLLQAILKANSGSTFMYVVDTRPKINAMANRASGKGYESEDNYQDIKFKFSGQYDVTVYNTSRGRKMMLAVCVCTILDFSRWDNLIENLS